MAALLVPLVPLVLLVLLCAWGEAVVRWPWPPVRQQVIWGVHNSYARQPLKVLGNKAQPNFVAQHAYGARLFEIDVYWWLNKHWLVAHFPILDSVSHVSTLEEATCTIRQLKESVMFLDVKTTLWRCTTEAVEGLQRALSACAQWGPLTVLMDISCSGAYDNTACAEALDGGTKINGTSVLFRGRDWWWLRPRCKDIQGAWAMQRKTSCHTYREPPGAANQSVVAPVPVLYECGDCEGADQRACVRRAVARPAKLVLVQTRSYAPFNTT